MPSGFPIHSCCPEILYLKQSMKRTIVILLLALISLEAYCQQKGHFLLGGGTSVIFGTGAPDSRSSVFYTLEAGISYDILESLRITGALGGFRSVFSFSRNGWSPEYANGLMGTIGADYLFLPEGSAFRPSVSLSAGYRLRVPPEVIPPGQVPSPVRPDGPFFTAGLGADVRFGGHGAAGRIGGHGAASRIGGLRLGFSLTASLTAALRPAAGLRLTALLP